jgi:hypothetical protein
MSQFIWDNLVGLGQYLTTAKASTAGTARKKANLIENLCY